MTNVRTVERLELPEQTLDFPSMVEDFQYLDGLPVKSYHRAVPRILIGIDNAKLTITLKRREGRSGEPVAAKTRLGWTVFGNLKEGFDDHTSLHICECSRDDKLHDLVRGFFELDSLGVDVKLPPASEEDQRAVRILRETTVRTPNGRYETGLLWKEDKVEFPDSYPMALRRMRCLEKKLQSTPELYANVRQQMMDYQAKGYAHKATEEELRTADQNRVWYLPLGVVMNPRKPGKVRVIWDAAAEVKGVSFNSKMLKGPDLLKPLPAVLSRFRQRQFAVTGDLKEMFHQIQIRPADRHSQRFLWRDSPGQPIETYVMDVATFGSTCSPCAAQYVKNLNAKEFEKEFPEAATAITDNHYVDDYLDSRDTEDEVVKLALEVKEVHSRGGFEIRNWLSNSNHVLSRVGEQHPGESKSIVVDKSNASERVLGLVWMPEEDVFSFDVKFREDLKPLIEGEKIPTKRQVLQVVMSLYDPLGMIAAFLIHGKTLIQNIWRTQIGWDEQISESLVEEWKRWIGLVEGLRKVKIDRCYFPGYNPDSYGSVELHVFVDASESAYCCVAYFRIVEDGQPRCALVSSKAKVAPLKPLSIPRMELQAAVMGVRLARAIEENHTLKITRRYFWSDSSTVLAWVRSDARKYRQFVAFRVGEILTKSSVEEWNWVPTKINVADEGTKWGKGPSFGQGSRWYSGPEFLLEPEENWPRRTEALHPTDEELRPMHVNICLHTSASQPVVRYERFSKWERLVRAVAFAHRYLRRRKLSDADGQMLTSEEIQRAQNTVWRLVQEEVYPEEKRILEEGQRLEPHLRKKLNRRSPLASLSPYVDEFGVIRTETRSRNSCFAPTSLVVLPRDHYVTALLINAFHRKLGHGNSETVVNEVRQEYHISRLRVVVKRVARECQWCRIYKATPETPRMGPLPEVRLTPYVRPFTFTGVDYCGPFFVRAGRSLVKRWIVLFTCMTIRAVHLELAYTLSTESFKLAVRRFIGRKGAPEELYSDNGTNFKGAYNELVEEVRSIDRELAATFTNAQTKWNFNPPSAPHMGGVWERLVRSVKTALLSLECPRNPDDETLWTIMVEAESIVNSRPLTYVPLDSEFQEALTPNHFLMLSSSGIRQPPRELVDGHVQLRQNWKLIQHVLSQFWSRWIKEYLPTITRRTKWFQDTKPVEVGDLVIVVEQNIRNGWIRGRVVKTFPGRDGRVRQAEVQTNTGILRRPVAKLAVLDVANEGKTSEDGKYYGSGNVFAPCTSTANTLRTHREPNPIGHNEAKEK